MLIKAKCHSQLLYTSSSFLHSTPPLPHSSLHPLLKPTFLFIVSLFPTPLDSLSFLAHFAASLLLPLPCHPILPPSPASFIPPPHYFTSPPAVFPLFSSPRASFLLLVSLTTHLLQSMYTSPFMMVIPPIRVKQGLLGSSNGIASATPIFCSHINHLSVRFTIYFKGLSQPFTTCNEGYNHLVYNRIYSFFPTDFLLKIS